MNREWISIGIAIICVLTIIGFVATNVIRFSDISSAIAYVLVAGTITVLIWGFRHKITGKITHSQAEKNESHFEQESKKETKESVDEKPKKLQNKKIKIRVDEYYDSKLNLKNGDLITGKISSDGFFNVYFLTESSFRSFRNDSGFKWLEGSEDVSHCELNFEAPRKGTYYLALENADKKNIVVEVELFHS